LPSHIQGGGAGVLIRGAGFILFNPDGTVAFLHGPHPQLDGDTAVPCAALARGSYRRAVRCRAARSVCRADRPT
jgi:hypothetical protein